MSKSKKNKRNERLMQGLMLFTCFIVLLIGSGVRSGKVFGYKLKSKETKADTQQAITDTIRTLNDGTIIINSTPLASDVMGFAGPIPLEISIKKGRIEKIVPLENEETTDFFDEAKVILDKWKDKTLDEAETLKVDVVSGATLSSNGIIKTMQRSVAYAKSSIKEESFRSKFDFSLSSIASLIVVLMAATLPICIKNKKYRTLQLWLNMLVIGFWTGTFVSYSLISNILTNGINIWTSLMPIVMLIIAFVYPYFGKKNYYCTNVCPCGSLQDLAAKSKIKKWKIPGKTTKRLNTFRKVLWYILMLLLITDIWAKWVEYEIFAAFLVQAASVVALTIGVTFALLSFKVQRPYCRFVCPTGTLFKVVERR